MHSDLMGAAGFQPAIHQRGGGMAAEQQVGCKTAEEARRKAERLGPLRPAVVAFSATADTELGDYDENPVILFRSGPLPHPFAD
jgi:hypothetical protein